MKSKTDAHLDQLRRLNLPMPGKMQALTRENRAIVDAVQHGNADLAAEDAMRALLSGTLANVDASSAHYPEFIQRDTETTSERCMVAV